MVYRGHGTPDVPGIVMAAGTDGEGGRDGGEEGGKGSGRTVGIS